jgi:group I intron endonuclease
MATISCIYKISNLENKKFYIGSTVNYKRRKKQHLWYFSIGKNSPRLQRSFNKYGESSFIFEIIETVDNINDLLKREQFYLDNLKPWDPEIGYNICKNAGSWLGNSHSEETKKILKDKATGYNHTKESKIKMSNSSPRISGENHHMYGKKHTDESKEKIKKSNSKLSGESHPMYQKKWDTSHLEKFSEKSRGKNNPMYGISLIDVWKEKYGEEEATRMWILSNKKRSKMVIQKTKEGDFIEEFLSISEASLKTGVNISLICKSCKGEKIKSGGYNWEYKKLINN